MNIQDIPEPEISSALQAEIFEKYKAKRLRSFPKEVVDSFPEGRTVFSFIPSVFSNDAKNVPCTTEADVISLAKQLIDWPGVRDWLIEHDWREDLTNSEWVVFYRLVCYFARDYDRDGHFRENLNIAFVMCRAITSGLLDEHDDAALFAYANDRLAKTRDEILNYSSARPMRLSEAKLLLEDIFRFDTEIVARYNEIRSLPTREERINYPWLEQPVFDGAEEFYCFKWRHVMKYGFANRDGGTWASLRGAMCSSVVELGRLDMQFVLSNLREDTMKYETDFSKLIDDLFEDGD